MSNGASELGPGIEELIERRVRHYHHKLEAETEQRQREISEDLLNLRSYIGAELVGLKTSIQEFITEQLQQLRKDTARPSRTSPARRRRRKP